MKFNTKTRYALRAMIEIALQSESSVYQKDIAKKQDISFKYLDQIIKALKSSGLIVNAEGKKSGYKLGRAPHEITVFDIYKAFEPELVVVECLHDDSNCSREKLCAAHEFWNGLNHQVISYLSSTTLHNLAREQKELNEKMPNDMYVI